jgi:hypothetical protein
MKADGFERQVQDLTFEIVEAPGPMVVIAVCDDPAQNALIVGHISKQLELRGRTLLIVAGRTSVSGLFKYFLNKSKAAIGAISLSTLDVMGTQSVDRFFAELNFRRDKLISLGVPILVWLSTDLLRRFVAIAPDFWSRRSTVYYFSRSRADQLIRRLFSRTPNGDERGGTKSLIPEALKTVLYSEDELNRCLRHRRSFSLAKADDLIKTLRSAVEDLIRECSSGKQLEVGLWLWNLSQLDYDVETMVEKLGGRERDLYQYLHTDRNEVVLHLCEETPRLLARYLDQLEQTIRQGKRVDIVSLLRSVATGKFGEMVRGLREAMSAEIVEYTDSHDWPSSSGAESAGVESREPAAYELESWLSGYSDQRPAFFSEAEGQVLKVLYTEKLTPGPLAAMLGIPPRKATAKIRYLERKVRAFLGFGPRPYSRRTTVSSRR